MVHISALWIQQNFSQMTDEERANRKKYDSVDSMREFSKWYKNITT